MDKHGVDPQTVRAVLKGRRGRSKSPEDVFAVIEIAILAEGMPRLQDFIIIKDSEIDKRGVLALLQRLINDHKYEIEKQSTLAPLQNLIIALQDGHDCDFDKGDIVGALQCLVNGHCEVEAEVENLATYLQYLLNGPEKAKPCTAARVPADHVKGNSHRSNVERLRREFRKNEKYYRLLARNWSLLMEWAFKWSRIWHLWPASEKASLEQEIRTAITDPLMRLYISHVTLPELSTIRKKLRERARELDAERAALVERRQELEIIHRWHTLASFEGLAVSEGTGKKQFQQAVDGINALRSALANTP